MMTRPARLWHHADFMKFWTGQTISVLGSNITGLALPLIAAVTLNATPEQMGILIALGQVAFLIVSLPAGTWIDRTRRRPIMIGADFGRALCVAAIPALALAGRLRMESLYGIALVSGILTVFFDLAYLAYLPELVSREHILEANAKLEASQSASQMAGPGLAGALIQWMGASMAVIFDALSFIISAITLSMIRQPEAAPEASREQHSIVDDIAEGIRGVTGNSLLRPLIMGVGLFYLMGAVSGAVTVLFLVDNLKLQPAAIGLIMSIAAPGTLLGAVIARRITERFGLGATLVGTLVIGPLGWLLVPFARPPAPLAIAMAAAGQTIMGACLTIFNINMMSLRQSITPDRLLGRVSATYRFIIIGLMPIGSLLGGLVGKWVGVRATLFISLGGSLIAAILLGFSPVVRLKTSQQAIEQYSIE